MARWLVFVLVSLVPALAAAQVNAIPSEPHLLVRGHAEANCVPDRFDISLQVAVTDKRPELARSKVEAHMREVFDGLKSSGATPDAIHASSLEIEPQTEYRDGKSVFVGTSVSRDVKATFDSVDKLRAFIAQLPAGPEVQVQNTHTWRSDIDKIRLDLRKKAIANSQEAAQKIADAYGLHIKGVYSVSEVAPNFAYGIQAGSWGDTSEDASLPPPPPAPGSLSSVTVTANALPSIDLRVGSINVQQDMYAVYLISP